MICAYCRKERAVHRDHIVPKALRRRHKGWDAVTVPACAACNWRKGTRRLVPVSWAGRLHELPGVKPWRVWDGSVEGLREVAR